MITKRRMPAKIYLVFGALTGSAPAPAMFTTWHAFASDTQEVADTILVNGKIIAVDAKDSIASAVAIRGGKIIAVGTNEEIRRRQSKRTVQKGIAVKQAQYVAKHELA